MLTELLLVYFFFPAVLLDFQNKFTKIIGIQDMSTSAFIAELLGANRLLFVGGALSLAKILLEKLPDIFVYYFKREGVLNQINVLADESYLNNDHGDDSCANSYDLLSWIHSQAILLKSTFFQESTVSPIFHLYKLFLKNC
jgi:hypothetical protein